MTEENDRARALADIFGPTDKGDYTLVEHQIILAGKIAKHAETIRTALLAQPSGEAVDLEALSNDIFRHCADESGWNSTKSLRWGECIELCLSYLAASGYLRQPEKK